MNRMVLLKNLNLVGINKNRYSINGPCEMKICIENNSSYWDVYFLEKGIKTLHKSFLNESDACDYMYHLLLNE